jgi:drug/metabolite transporter (DMT)-like permease
VKKIIYLPLLGAFLEGVGVTIQKRVLRKHNVNNRNYIIYGFLSIVLVMLPFIYFFWQVEPEATTILNISILLAIVILSILANLFVIYSLKKEDISEIEPIRLTQPLLTILIAFILSFFFEIFQDEKSVSILVLSIIASIVLIWSHTEKNHLKFSKYDYAALIGGLLFAIELVISKFILSYYNSFTFYFLRCLLIFIITWILFHSKLGPLKGKTKAMIFIVGIIWTIYRVIMYYGYQTLGIVFTTMLFILAPIFIYLFAWMFLKEKIQWKQIISSIIIVICIVVAIVING